MDLSLFLNTLLFRSASQPGLARVLMMIFDFEGISIRRRKAMNLRGGPQNEYGYCIGKAFGELHMQYDTATSWLGGQTSQPSNNRKKWVLVWRVIPILSFKKTVTPFPAQSLLLLNTLTHKTAFRQVQGRCSKKDKSFERPEFVSGKTWKNMICGWRAVWKVRFEVYSFDNFSYVL